MTLFIPTSCDSCAEPVPFPPVTSLGLPFRWVCPECAVREALEDAAAQQLHTLIYSTVLDWARHWKAEGVSDDALSTLLAVEGAYWHPDGGQHRGPGDAFDSAAAVIREAGGEG